MKGMPLPFEFEGKGVLELDSLVVKNNNKTTFVASPEVVSSYFLDKNCFFSSFVDKNCVFSSNNNYNNSSGNSSFGEPTSVLDSARIILNGPTSSSTLSSSLGGGGGGGGSTDTAGVAAVSDTNTNPSPKWQHQESNTATSSNAGGGGAAADSGLAPIPQSLQGPNNNNNNVDKLAMEDWESVLSESPSQEQSILRWIMGDVEDPAMGSLNKVLQIGSTAAPEFDIGGGFGVVDQDQFGANLMPAIPSFNSNITRSEKIEMKPPIFNPQLLINQHQAQHGQNPSFFFPLSYQQQQQQQEQNLFVPPLAKRHNPGVPIGLEPGGGPILKGPFSDTGQQELFMGRQNLNLQAQAGLPHQLLPHYLQQRPAGPGQKPKMDEFGHCHQQQGIVDQLYKAAELVQTGNLVHAQGILARLNHQLSPIGKPFHRAAFYCKEALQLLLNTNSNHNNLNSSPFSLIFKIGAYKSFSEISPVIQFANFTCNQAILEVLDGFDRIHIVDFDIGYGGQWASFMQELALRSGGAPMLKITALASPSTHDQLELGLTRENLIQFASEINITLEFEVVGIDSLNSGSWSLPFHVNENEAVAVNLPVGCLATYQLSIPLVLRFVKQLSPRIVVSVDRGCDRTDLPFANHIIHALQSYSNLFESLDAVNVNMDALQKIERFLIHPGIEKIITGRFRAQEKTQHWRALFLSSGFTPVTFSNFTESQAECVIKRTPVRGFQVEKRQSSLVLCWQRKELISASAWRCC